MPPDEMDSENEETTTGGSSPSYEAQQEYDAMVAAADAAMAAEADGETSDDDSDDDDAPKKPVKAAPRDEDDDEDELDEDEPPPKPVPKAAPKAKEVAKPLSKLAQDLEEREQKRAATKDYQARIVEADAALGRARQAEQYATQIAQQAEAKYREAQELLNDIRQNPGSALKKLGWTPDQFIDEAVRENDPNRKAVLGVQAELERRDQKIDKLTNLVESLVRKAQGYDTQTQAQQQQAEVQQLFSSIPEESPVWQDYEDEDDILYAANKARRKYKEKTGRVATPAEIGEYLHYRALKKRQGAAGETSAQRQKKAGKTSANGSRALGNSDSSERRSNGRKPISDMDGDEERQFLIEVAERAISEG